MASKEVQRELISNAPKDVNLNQMKLPVLRKSISFCALSNDTKCPMQIIIFLGQDHNFYLSTRSVLQHRHHPPITSQAILCNDKDLNTRELDLLNLLYKANVSPKQQSQIFEELKAPEFGTFLPRTLFNMNKKTEALRDLALGLIPGCSDAEKTIAKLTS